MLKVFGLTLAILQTPNLMHPEGEMLIGNIYLTHSQAGCAASLAHIRARLTRERKATPGVYFVAYCKEVEIPEIRMNKR